MCSLLWKRSKQRLLKKQGFRWLLSLAHLENSPRKSKTAHPMIIFLSANMKYPRYLHEEKMTQTAPTKYALGKLVYWSMHPMKELPLEQLLLFASLKRLAIANPKNAPYGLQAVFLLKNLGLHKKLQSKLVYGDSISQTNQYIYSKAADAGFTAKSAVLSPKMQGKGTWIEPSMSLYKPIEQGMVILKKANPQAKKFYDFMQQPTAQTILKRYGYAIPQEIE